MFVHVCSGWWFFATPMKNIVVNQVFFSKWSETFLTIFETTNYYYIDVMSLQDHLGILELEPPFQRQFLPNIELVS